MTLLEFSMIPSTANRFITSPFTVLPELPDSNVSPLDDPALVPFISIVSVPFNALGAVAVFTLDPVWL